MTFFDSIKTVFRKYAEFNGRASRPEFWWFVLFTALASAALGLISGSGEATFSFLSPMVFQPFANLAALWNLAVLLPSLAVTVRRLRDAGFHWAHMFWLLLPLAGPLVLIVLVAQPSKDRAPADASLPSSMESPQPL